MCGAAVGAGWAVGPEWLVLGVAGLVGVGLVEEGTGVVLLVDGSEVDGVVVGLVVVVEDLVTGDVEIVVTVVTKTIQMVTIIDHNV